MELFAKIVKVIQPLTFSAKISILDICLGSEQISKIQKSQQRIFDLF